MPLLLTEDDLRPLVTSSDAMEGAFEAVEAAYREYQDRQTRPIDTVGLPLTGAQRSLRVCPGVAGAGVSIRTYPTLEREEFPDSSVNLLFDADHGRLLAIMAGDELNGFRTAAPGGLAARLLAPDGVRTLAMLGSGRQARAFLPAMKHALPTLERVRVYSPTPAHREDYARAMTQAHEVVVEAVADPRTAVEGADVILVVSSADQPVLATDWVQPHALIVSISGGQLPPDLITRSRLTVSARDEVLNKGRRAPYDALHASGALAAEQAVEIGEVITGHALGRRDQNEIVIHEMPGLSIWDAAILGWAYDWAVREGAGTSFNLSTADV